MGSFLSFVSKLSSNLGFKKAYDLSTGIVIGVITVVWGVQTWEDYHVKSLKAKEDALLKDYFEQTKVVPSSYVDFINNKFGVTDPEKVKDYYVIIKLNEKLLQEKLANLKYQENLIEIKKKFKDDNFIIDYPNINNVNSIKDNDKIPDFPVVDNKLKAKTDLAPVPKLLNDRKNDNL